MIEEYRGMKYSDRLDVSGWTSLEDRRNRSDLIEVFKMIKGISKVKYRISFTLDANSRTQGHKYKLVKNRSRLEIRTNSFS
jgi:hypothetical protein